MLPELVLNLPHRGDQNNGWIVTRPGYESDRLRN
jgi:hypothetical protein